MLTVEEIRTWLEAGGGLTLAIAFGTALLGFGIGRASGPRARHARGLRSELETARKQVDRLAGELEASREESQRYRGSVAEHFTGTSERLRELTLQYREIYEHLSEGARSLCPESFRPLEGGLGLDALSEGARIDEALPGEGQDAGMAEALETDEEPRP